MFELNKDILFLIFKELQDDSKSLFSCLMANRLWCETVVTILWKNPWHYNINYKDKGYLFVIIASYLSNDIKEFLTRQGIQLSSVSHKSLLFDYLSFCRSININNINAIISTGSSSAYNQFILQQEFYGLFMKKCPEFNYLDMKSINHQIFYFSEARSHLESLCELECNTFIDSSYFYGLARLCQYIQRLIISNNNLKVNHGMIKLIEVQKNLKYIEWEDDLDGDYFGEESYKEVLHAIEKKADILNHLKIFFLNISNTFQKVLPKLNKLKTLMIINGVDFFSKDQSKMLVFHDLEILSIDYIKLYEASSIIGNSGGYIKEILLKPYCFVICEVNFDENSLIFIHKIYENCPLIEYLSLAFPLSKEHLTEFEKLLKACQKLKSLLFMLSNIDHEETHEEEKEDELLKALIRSASTNLRELRFFNDFKFSLENLEEFLEKWRGRPALSILTSNPICKDDDYIKLINKYKNYGVVKDFRYELEKDIYFKR